MSENDRSSLIAHNIIKTEEAFDESLLGDLCDAHCHPHDDIQQLHLIPQLKTGHITIMGVRLDDWDRVSTVTKECNKMYDKKCIPCFGIHPWFSHQLSVNKNTTDNKDTHYFSILKGPEEEIQGLIVDLQPPIAYSIWYNDLRARLMEHPEALVGEVGVDRAARLLPGGGVEWHGVKPTNVQCAVEHQMAVLDIQLNLARELKRAASIHCVQGQGNLFDYLRSQSTQFSTNKLKKLFHPPSILRLCLHSYNGSPATLPQFFKLKGFKIYLSFSVVINSKLAPKKLVDIIKAVPEDRLLIESDLNSPIGLDMCMVEITKIIASARGWSIDEVVKRTRKNWHEFVDNTNVPLIYTPSNT
ncbi:hypothetical protein BDB01DRAFT_716286 [Pilobolus umbonatus]|nr:hypothetical protein BDB01DRAFT_716286 [Pilobolus umbonatus]